MKLRTLLLLVIAGGVSYLYVLNRPADVSNNDKQNGINTAGKTESKNDNELFPEIISMRLSPQNPGKNDNIKVSVESRTSLNEQISYQYRWFINKVQVKEAISDTLSGRHTNHGDLVSVEVTAIAGKYASRSIQSPAVKVLNSPPVVKNVPSANVSLDGYKFDVFDADSDPITFSLIDAPVGMTITEDGVIKVEITQQTVPGNYDVSLKIDDGDSGIKILKIPFSITPK